jgi:hypothetical protein
MGFATDMPSKLRALEATLLAGCTVALAAYASIHADAPTPVSPFSFAAISAEYFFAGYGDTSSAKIHALAALPVTIIFWIWSYPLFRGAARIPRRSKLLYLCVLAATAWSMIDAWPYGVTEQGLLHTWVVFSYNALAAFAVGAAWFRSSRGESFVANLAFHAGLFTWIAWSALPWLGELD